MEVAADSHTVEEVVAGTVREGRMIRSLVRWTKSRAIGRLGPVKHRFLLE